MSRSATLLLAVALTLLAGDGFSPLGPGRSGAENAVPRVAPGFFDPAQRAGSAYKNLDPEYRRASYWARLHSLVTGATWLVSESRVAPLPLGTPDWAALRDRRPHAPTVTWIGHSTVLVQLDGVNFLTDPTWADRSGPFSGFIGVRRYTPPGIPFDDLPPIDFVLISHDHYDHLDEPTVRRLARTSDPLFVVPLGIKAWLADRGITNAVELDWGESVTVKGLTVVCTPAQHGGGRTAIDQGRRLWSSWAVLGSKRFYFGGDTGYYRHFAGDRRPARPLRPGRPADRVLHAARHRQGRAHLAGGSAAGRAGPARFPPARRALGHLRPRPGAVRRAAGPHARRDRAARDRPGHRLDPQARRDPDLVVFSLSPTGRGQGEGKPYIQ